MAQPLIVGVAAPSLLYLPLYLLEHDASSYLGEATNLKVEIRPCAADGGVLDQLKEGKIDVGICDPMVAVRDNKVLGGMAKGKNAVSIVGTLVGECGLWAVGGGFFQDVMGARGDITLKSLIELPGHHVDKIVIFDGDSTAQRVARYLVRECINENEQSPKLETVPYGEEMKNALLARPDDRCIALSCDLLGAFLLDRALRSRGVTRNSGSRYTKIGWIEPLCESDSSYEIFDSILFTGIIANANTISAKKETLRALLRGIQTILDRLHDAQHRGAVIDDFMRSLGRRESVYRELAAPIFLDASIAGVAISEKDVLEQIKEAITYATKHELYPKEINVSTAGWRNAISLWFPDELKGLNSEQSEDRLRQLLRMNYVKDLAEEINPPSVIAKGVRSVTKWWHGLPVIGKLSSITGSAAILVGSLAIYIDWALPTKDHFWIYPALVVTAALLMYAVRQYGYKAGGR